MKHFLRLGLPAVLLLAAAPLAWADIPPPIPQPNPTPPPQPTLAKTQLVVEINNNATKAQLLIPRQLIAAQGPASSGPLQQGAMTPVPTAVAGVCLSLAVVCGGVWMVRRKARKLGMVPLSLAVGLVSAILVAGVASPLLWADVPAPIPPSNPSITVADDVQVVIVPHGDAIKLVVNQAMYHRLKNTPIVGGSPSPGE